MFPSLDLGPLERYRVGPNSRKFNLAEIDPGDKQAVPRGKDEVEVATAADITEIIRLQEILYAQARQAVLIVLQGMDTSGKDAVVRRVFGGIDPLGIVA